jgi:molybdate transport system substrate-binding protein
MNVVFTVVALAIACVWSSTASAQRGPEPITVFAAASLTDTLQRISEAYTAASGVPVRLSFAASSALARQIESGARADVFFSADEEWMNYLQERKLIQSETRVALLENRLVLIAPSESTVAIDLESKPSLLPALGARGRVAIADPDAVPAGRYGRAALMSLGMWRDAERRLARAENVRVALMYVARGETPLGIVYATDAQLDRRVRVVDVFPANTHPAITYSVALTAAARPAAQAYLEYLRSDAARKIFGEAGFTVAILE